MKNQIKYVQVTADNEELCKAFKTLMVPYMNELDAHSDDPLPMDLLPKWIDSIIAMQGLSSAQHAVRRYSSNEKPLYNGQ